MKKNSYPSKRAPHDWQGLIDEFEERANAKQRASPPPPPGVVLENERADDLPLMPAVETSLMSALTFVLWQFGRLLRLDAFLVMFYPLPMFFITMRWGVKKGAEVLIGAAFLILGLMGPMYGFLWIVNTCFMAYVMAHAFWRQWHWSATVVLGGLAKGAGLAVQCTWMSGIIRYDSWTFIAQQVRVLVDKTLRFAFWVTRQSATPPTPNIEQIRVAVAVVLVLHSILHVFFTYLSACMILDRVGDGVKFQRKIRLPGLLQKIKDNTKRKFSDTLYR